MSPFRSALALLSLHATGSPVGEGLERFHEPSIFTGYTYRETAVVPGPGSVFDHEAVNTRNPESNYAFQVSACGVSHLYSGVWSWD
jgi:hypothetical protein